MEIYHYWGNDLAVGATGGLLLADGAERSRQRVLRRLLTNPGDYIWHPGYGAGLPSYIGANLDIPALTALIRAQMYLEASVSRDPEPVIALQAIAGGVAARITYTESEGGRPLLLSFDTLEG